MVIYSVTVSVKTENQTAWLEWMMTEHIPEILKTGYFNESKAFQVLEPTEEGKVRFTIQYDCKSMDDYRKYRETESERLASKHNEKFEDISISRELLAPLNIPEGKVKF